MMKKMIAILLCLILLVSAAACSADGPQVSEPTGPVITEEVKAKLDAVLQDKNYEGIVYLTFNGEVVYQSVSGTNDMGNPLTIDSPMYICSMSKQFCASAILMLRDQGKLSLDDTLEKYFPEYTIGKDITLKNLLTMRSGICRDVDPMLEEPEKYENNTAEENEALFKEYVFGRTLLFTPGTDFAYSNNNYRLLSFIVEMVSDQNYEDFIRQNIFEPLGMTHSGFSIEVPDHPEWGLTYDNIQATGGVPVLAQGAGGIVTTAADMDIWMTALQSGEVICMESFREMTTNYSPGTANRYGYGLMGTSRDGWGHTGGNLHYTSRTYFSEEYGFNLYMVTNKSPLNNPAITDQAGTEILSVLYQFIEMAASN